MFTYILHRILTETTASITLKASLQVNSTTYSNMYHEHQTMQH